MTSRSSGGSFVQSRARSYVPGAPKASLTFGLTSSSSPRFGPRNPTLPLGIWAITKFSKRNIHPSILWPLFLPVPAPHHVSPYFSPSSSPPYTASKQPHNETQRRRSVQLFVPAGQESVLKQPGLCPGRTLLPLLEGVPILIVAVEKWPSEFRSFSGRAIVAL
ncbi:hypothetical protein NEUTE2DRAFT_59999 [Neurospora tetrasperma FGSC 2509]|nr:hypothetical protein NEUTE2DRAFT_59999 [Neurospora tetrasperma FGSC 2509]